jgi:hypothetical protein
VGLALHHTRAGEQVLVIGHISDPQRDQIAAAQPAVDRQVEQRQVAGLPRHPQACAYCPDLCQLERRLLADQLVLVPGCPRGSIQMG